MRELKFLFGVILLSSVLISCSTESEIILEKADNNLIALEKEKNLSSLFYLPENSNIYKNGSETTFKLPKGYSLVGKDNSGNLRRSGGGKWTCTCESADGSCKPTETNDTIGCNSEKENICKVCVGKMGISTIDGDVELVEFFIQTPKDFSSEMAKFSNVRPVQDYSEWNSLEWITTEEMQKYEYLVKELITNEQAKAAINNSTSRTVSIPIVINDRKILVDLPFDSVERGSLYSLVDDGGKQYCTGCNGSCCLKKAAFGKVRYCDCCNSGCTLHWE